MARWKLTLPTANAKQNVAGTAVLRRRRALVSLGPPEPRHFETEKLWTFSHVFSQRCASAFAFSLGRDLNGICDRICGWQRFRVQTGM